MLRIILQEDEGNVTVVIADKGASIRMTARDVTILLASVRNAVRTRNTLPSRSLGSRQRHHSLLQTCQVSGACG